MLGVTEERLRAAEDSYAMVSKSFEEGLVNEIKEKDARMGMNSARMSNTLATYDLMIAKARLDHSMGVAEWASTAE